MARAFNGTSDVINFGTPTGLNGATKATSAGWIFRSTTGTRVGFGGAGGASGGGDRFSFIWFTDGNVYCAAEGAPIGGPCYGFFALAGTGYHHITIVFDGSQAGNSTRLVVYLDGVAQTLSFSGTIPAALGNVGPFLIGKDSSDRFDGGSCAEVALWTGVALTANDAKGLALGRTAPWRIQFRPTLYAPLWGLQSPEPDISGNGASGTLTGTTQANHAPVTLFTPKHRTYPQLANGIEFDGASNSGYQTAQSTYTWNHTCTGANRHLLVGISMLSVAGSSVSEITYNGVAMTFLGAKASVSGAVRVELWGLVAPATGTNAIAVTLSTALDSVGGAISTTGVHQTSPTEAFNSASATNVGAADATVDVTTVADNDWVLDAVATSDTAITVTGTQTQRSNISGALGSGATGSQGPQTPPGTVTSAWTNVGALATWSIAAIALRPIAAANLGSQTPWYLFERMVA